MDQMYSNVEFLNISQSSGLLNRSFEFSHWGSLCAALPSSCLSWQLTEPFASVSAHMTYANIIWIFELFWISVCFFCRKICSIFQVCGHLHYTEEDHDSNVGKEAKQLRPLGCFEVKARQETIEIHGDRTQARVCASRLATDLYPQFVARNEGVSGCTLDFSGKHAFWQIQTRMDQESTSSLMRRKCVWAAVKEGNGQRTDVKAQVRFS